MDEQKEMDMGLPGRSRGGKARMQRLSAGERKELASSAARKRWSQQRVAARTSGQPVADGSDRVPAALARGTLQVGDAQLPCYVLDNDDRDRVFSLKGVVVGLIKTEGGQLAEYIKVKSLRPFLPDDLVPAENDNIPALIC